MALPHDEGGADTPAPVGLRILNPDADDMRPLHHLLLRRSDGSHVLLMWFEMKSEDDDQGRTVEVLLDPTPLRARHRLLDQPQRPAVALSPAAMSVQVTDYPSAIELDGVCR